MSEVCGDCQGCTFVAWKESRIEDAEARKQKIINLTAGLAQLEAEVASPDVDAFALDLELSDGVREAIARRAEVGKVHIVNLLTADDKLAQEYFKYMDYTDRQIEKDRKAIELAQSTCHGPAKKREHFLWGPWMWVCTGQQSLHDRVESSGYLNIHKR